MSLDWFFGHQGWLFSPVFNRRSREEIVMVILIALFFCWIASSIFQGHSFQPIVGADGCTAYFDNTAQPSEIDKEAMNVDAGFSYGIPFYEATQNKIHPKELDELASLLSNA